jgi:hypothetical protein
MPGAARIRRCRIFKGSGDAVVEIRGAMCHGVVATTAVTTTTTVVVCTYHHHHTIFTFLFLSIFVSTASNAFSTAPNAFSTVSNAFGTVNAYFACCSSRTTSSRDTDVGTFFQFGPKRAHYQ